MAASNTKDCFREFIGRKVVGVLFDALPVGRSELQKGTKALIFDDGRALLIHATGSFGIVTATDVRRAVKLKEGQLRSVQSDLRGVLELAGAVDA